MDKISFIIRGQQDRDMVSFLAKTMPIGAQFDFEQGGEVYGRGIIERHGRAGTRAYNIWSGMIQRCCNPNNEAFPRYGGRGISVSESWMKFSNFFADMGEPPPEMSLDRVDNNKGYSKENCAWASRTTQGRNKRNNMLMTVDGETLPLSVLAEMYGINATTVRARMKKGWSHEDAVKLPLVKNRVGIPRGEPIHRSKSGLILFRGEEMTLRDAARKAGISHGTVYNRMRKGWSLNDALSEPARRGPHKHRIGYRYGSRDST